MKSTYPELKMKRSKKVDVNRGLNCTRDMANTDQLDVEINQASIGELAYVEPGVWTGAIDLSR